jgi:hypothetical protein
MAPIAAFTSGSHPGSEGAKRGRVWVERAARIRTVRPSGLETDALPLSYSSIQASYSTPPDIAKLEARSRFSLVVEFSDGLGEIVTELTRLRDFL